ncbi:MAG: DNA-processing protein DprA [Clostridia bacterium]|nr:DNA-processing protein DprA [Clostridia bacterium]
MKQKEMLFWIWLSEKLGAANRDFSKLIKLYDNPYELFHAEDAELERIEGITPRTVSVLSDKSLEHATAILDECERLGIGILPYHDALYPRALRELCQPPSVLYYLGDPTMLNTSLCIGMVGTRRMSEYGLRRAYKLSYELASVGAVVVSGMASGIDGVSAAAAIAAGGKTAAVLGCGLDVVYPKHHKGLMHEIGKKGLLLSEYPPGTRPNHYHFPIRNRIISGLAQGTVVVEAGMGSGSLITAKDAILQGKDVFTVPANVGTPGAEGTNGLLRDGAHPVLQTGDILTHYRYLYADMLDMKKLSDAEQKSMADLRYLARLGVIELTERTEPRPTEQPAAGSKPRRATRNKPSSRETAEDTREHAPSAPATENRHEQTPDEILRSLSPIQLAILQAIPDDRAVTADALSGMGYPYGDLIAALTMLEILGLIQKLPGALYTKS